MDMGLAKDTEAPALGMSARDEIKIEQIDMENLPNEKMHGAKSSTTNRQGQRALSRYNNRYLGQILAAISKQKVHDHYPISNLLKEDGKVPD